MQRRFIYLINPISGTKDKDSLLSIIDKKTSARKIPFEILHTNAEGDYEFLRRKIATENITDIIVCGGDGTINQVAASLLHFPVNIGIIPMGSGNGLALASGISKNPAKALKVIFDGNADEIDGFYINGKFSCMLCGLGFDAQVAHDFSKQEKRGLSTYVKQTLRNFKIAPTYYFKILVNGVHINTEAYFISIANSNQFGNNVTIAPKASLKDGLIDLVIVNKMSKTKLLYAIGKQLLFGNVADAAQNIAYDNEDIHYFQTNELFIENIDSAPLHIDGDPVPTAATFSIKIVHKAFRLLQP